jgi:uncharacterized short protein YbdD (DUF466 family)
MTRVRQILRGFWELARELCGDKAYSRYRVHILARGGQPMTPQEFYLWRVQHKYSSPARCC